MCCAHRRVSQSAGYETITGCRKRVQGQALVAATDHQLTSGRSAPDSSGYAYWPTGFIAMRCGRCVRHEPRQCAHCGVQIRTRYTHSAAPIHTPSARQYRAPSLAQAQFSPTQPCSCGSIEEIHEAKPSPNPMVGHWREPGSSGHSQARTISHGYADTETWSIMDRMRLPSNHFAASGSGS